MSDSVSSFIAKRQFSAEVLFAVERPALTSLKCSEMECSLNKTKQRHRSISPESTLPRAVLDLLWLFGGKHDYEIASQQTSFCFVVLFSIGYAELVEQCSRNKWIKFILKSLEEKYRAKVGSKFTELNQVELA